MPLNLANRITVFRFLCVPVFTLLVIYYILGVKHGDVLPILRYSATFLFLGAVFLDALDGYIARSRNQITKLGTIMDPLADKALLLSSLILLSYPSCTAFHPSLPVWFVILVISRDVVLVVGCSIIHFCCGSVTIKPRLSGKGTTFFQITVIFWVLIGIPEVGFIYILWTAAILTIVSGIQYIFDGIKQLEKIF